MISIYPVVGPTSDSPSALRCTPSVDPSPARPSTASVGQRLSIVTGTANTEVNESEGLGGITEKGSQQYGMR